MRRRCAPGNRPDLATPRRRVSRRPGEPVARRRLFGEGSNVRVPPVQSELRPQGTRVRKNILGQPHPEDVRRAQGRCIPKKPQEPCPNVPEGAQVSLEEYRLFKQWADYREWLKEIKAWKSGQQYRSIEEREQIAWAKHLEALEKEMEREFRLGRSKIKPPALMTEEEQAMFHSGSEPPPPAQPPPPPKSPKKKRQGCIVKTDKWGNKIRYNYRGDPHPDDERAACGLGPYPKPDLCPPPVDSEGYMLPKRLMSREQQEAAHQWEEYQIYLDKKKAWETNTQYLPDSGFYHEMARDIFDPGKAAARAQREEQKAGRPRARSTGALQPRPGPSGSAPARSTSAKARIPLAAPKHVREPVNKMPFLRRGEKKPRGPGVPARRPKIGAAKSTVGEMMRRSTRESSARDDGCVLVCPIDPPPPSDAGCPPSESYMSPEPGPSGYYVTQYDTPPTPPSPPPLEDMEYWQQLQWAETQGGMRRRAEERARRMEAGRSLHPRRVRGLEDPCESVHKYDPDSRIFERRCTFVERPRVAMFRAEDPATQIQEPSGEPYRTHEPIEDTCEGDAMDDIDAENEAAIAEEADKLCYDLRQPTKFDALRDTGPSPPRNWRHGAINDRLIRLATDTWEPDPGAIDELCPRFPPPPQPWHENVRLYHPIQPPRLFIESRTRLSDRVSEAREEAEQFQYPALPPIRRGGGEWGEPVAEDASARQRYEAVRERMMLSAATPAPLPPPTPSPIYDRRYPEPLDMEWECIEGGPPSPPMYPPSDSRPDYQRRRSDFNRMVPVGQLLPLSPSPPRKIPFGEESDESISDAWCRYRNYYDRARPTLSPFSSPYASREEEMRDIERRVRRTFEEIDDPIIDWEREHELDVGELCDVEEPEPSFTEDEINMSFEEHPFEFLEDDYCPPSPPHPPRYNLGPYGTELMEELSPWEERFQRHGYGPEGRRLLRHMSRYGDPDGPLVCDIEPPI